VDLRWPCFRIAPHNPAPGKRTGDASDFLPQQAGRALLRDALTAQSKTLERAENSRVGRVGWKSPASKRGTGHFETPELAAPAPRTDLNSKRVEQTLIRADRRRFAHTDNPPGDTQRQGIENREHEAKSQLQ
jgi:hypothetical protein